MGSHKLKTPAQRHTDQQTERELDQELEQTFPASDPPQITRDRDVPPAPDNRRRRPSTKRGK